MAESSLREKAARGFLWGGLNNGLVQIIGALFGIVILRHLAPDDYGKISMLMVFPALASILQESGFTAALCNLKEPTHRDYNAVFWFNIGVSALLYGALFFCAPLIARFYNDPSLLPLSRYLFLGFFISSWGTVQRAYLFIHLMNKESCIIALTSLVLSNTVGLLMVLAGFSYWGLATQNILFILIVAVMNWWYSPWRPTLQIDMAPVRKMFGFSSKLLFTNIINTLSSQAFSFLLGKFYGDYTAGIYGNARKWDDMCANTINGMVTGVALPVLSKVRDERERYRQVFRKMLRFVSFVSFPCMLGMGFVAREFLLVVVGPKWEASAELLSMFSVYGAIFPLMTLYGQMVIGQGKSQINMWCTIGLSSLILIGLWALHPFGVHTMVVYFIALNALWLLVWQFFALRLIRLSFWHAFCDVAPFLLLSLGSMAVAWTATRAIENIYLLLAGKIAVTALCYVGILWILRARILRESIDYFLHKRKQ
ncbi:MAG: lipopolysaccharide biosynthesis protein [Bacteroidaceae bacterium]|jgi:O-antigen/teichoic acid export membrane protein|nr:lipopolysaccharide biosynthesis protein [Bacteroidaceae bacterium]